MAIIDLNVKNHQIEMNKAVSIAIPMNMMLRIVLLEIMNTKGFLKF